MDNPGTKDSPKSQIAYKYLQLWYTWIILVPGKAIQAKSLEIGTVHG